MEFVLLLLIFGAPFLAVLLIGGIIAIHASLHFFETAADSALRGERWLRRGVGLAVLGAWIGALYLVRPFVIPLIPIAMLLRAFIGHLFGL